MLDLSGFSAEDISAMSGRICAPGIPPKSKAEAREHIQLIRKLLEHERSLAAVEAKESRERREILERNVSHWNDIVFRDFDAEVRSKATVALWSRHGIPHEVRGQAWSRIIGNRQQITPRLYEVCVRKSQSRMHAAASGSSGAFSSYAGPHSRSLSSCEEMVTARSKREEDPTFFSPKLSKLESMLQINVDLPRTIISRAVAAASPTPSSPFCSSPISSGLSPLQSPRRSASEGRDEISSSSFSAQATDRGRTTPSSSSNPTMTSEVAAGLSNSSMLISSMCDDVLLARVRKALCAYVEYRPDIGYLQGMSYLAAMILLHMQDDQDGFIALANLLGVGHFRYFYSVHHQGMGVYIAAFDDVLKRSLPELHNNFALIGVHPQMYVIDWWMSMFSRALPYETAARCWDLYLLDEAYLFRLSVAILVYFSPYIHEESPLDEVMIFLSKVQRQHVDEKKFFLIVDDDTMCGSSLQATREILREWQTKLIPVDVSDDL